MTLPKNRRTTSRGMTRTPFWLLTLPRWAAPADSGLRAVQAAPETRWTCARCGAVASDVASATEHINLHSLRVAPQPPGADCQAIPARAGARRRPGTAVRVRNRTARSR
jgi:hypothetical protein